MTTASIFRYYLKAFEESRLYPHMCVYIYIYTHKCIQIPMWIIANIDIICVSFSDIRDVDKCTNSTPNINLYISSEYCKHLVLETQEGQAIISHPFPHQLTYKYKVHPLLKIWCTYKYIYSIYKYV